MSRPKIVKFDFGRDCNTSDTPQDRNKKVDEIILWDAYWEQRLIKNGIGQNTITKLRILPHQKKVELVLVFYFKHDNDGYNKEKAQFSLKIEVPKTIYGCKEFTITGKDILNNKYFYTQYINGKTYYCCKIANFSSDLKDAQIPQPFKEKQYK